MASASSIMIIDAIYMGHPHRRMSNGIFFVSMSPPDYNSTTPKNQQFKAESIKDNQTCFLFGRLEEQNLCFVENTKSLSRGTKTFVLSKTPGRTIDVFSTNDPNNKSRQGSSPDKSENETLFSRRKIYLLFLRFSVMKLFHLQGKHREIPRKASEDNI